MPQDVIEGIPCRDAPGLLALRLVLGDQRRQWFFRRDFELRGTLVRATVVVASPLQKLIEPAVLSPTQVLDQPAHGCRRRDEPAAGIGIRQTGNLAHHDVSIVVEKRLQRGALIDYAMHTTIRTLRFCHDGEASRVSAVPGYCGSPRPTAWHRTAAARSARKLPLVR